MLGFVLTPFGAYIAVSSAARPLLHDHRRIELQYGYIVPTAARLC